MDLANAAVKEASLSVPELNNFVVSLIKPLRHARVRVIRHLSNKLKKLRSSKKSSDVIEKKVKNMVEEIQHLKAMMLKTDVVKQLLCKKFSEKDLSKAATPADRALTRLALQKSPFTDQVAKFRQEHEDWTSLAEFLLGKHGGRRFRKRNAKSSSEKLAKATLDVADKRARENYASNDQRHQHNKRPSKMPDATDEAVELTNIDEIAVSSPQSSASEVATTNQQPWLSSIFSVSKEMTPKESNDISVPESTNNSSSQSESKADVMDEGNTTEAVVYKLDPNLLNKVNNVAAVLEVPAANARRKKVASKEHTESAVPENSEKPVDTADGEEDFFMSISNDNPDEICRPGMVLAFDHSADYNDDTVPSRYRNNKGKRRDQTESFDRQRSKPFDGFRQQVDRQKAPTAAPKNEEKLHASWEARRQQRNQQKLRIPTAGDASSKKHIVFDE